MFHPIPPDLSGTDGMTNLPENEAMRLALMRENTSVLRSDIPVRLHNVHSVAEFSRGCCLAASLLPRFAAIAQIDRPIATTAA
jgi:hypothetical protein